MASHEVVRFPASRIGTVDLGRIGTRKHHITALLEVDVTDTIRRVRAERREGAGASFFSWITKAISATIEENRHIHALRKGKHEVVVFEDIDISVMVEKTVDGERVPLPLLIRKTNAKSAEEIHAQIQAAKRNPVGDESDYVLREDRIPRSLMRLYYALPQRLRVFAMNRILRNAHRAKRMMGTAIITTAAGRASGWVIPKAMHNLCFALGPIVQKPWVVGGAVVVRDILHLTVLVDHDVVDGVPASRFLTKLVSRIEKGRSD